MSLFKTALLASMLIAIPWASILESQEPSLSELLEKGIYTEEAVGDLEAAIKIYGRIVKHGEAQRPIVARALYRMGTCFLKSGKKARAMAAFQKLVKDFADQGDLVARARAHLPGPEAAKASLVPAPWEDGEVLRFSMKFNPISGPGKLAGTHLGETIYSVFQKQVSGKPAWRQEQYMGCPKFGVRKYCYVEAELDGFLPLTSVLYHSNIGQARTEYTGKERRLILNRPGKKPAPEPFVQKLEQAVFDNEQNIYIARRLPLKMGFKTRITLAGRPGSVYNVDIHVVGQEIVEVQAGKFECFRISLSVGSISETYWISKCPHRYPVKLESAEAVLELVEISRRNTKARTYEEKELGFSLEVPAGWEILRCAGSGCKEEGRVQVFSPGMTVWGMVFFEASKEVVSARDSAEKQIKGMKKKIKDYRVRPGTLKEMKLSGFTAMAYVADHTLRGWNLTEHHTCISTDKGVFFFVFVVDREQFDSYRDFIRSILDSFKVKE